MSDLFKDIPEFVEVSIKQHIPSLAMECPFSVRYPPESVGC